MAIPRRHGHGQQEDGDDDREPRKDGVYNGYAVMGVVVSVLNLASDDLDNDIHSKTSVSVLLVLFRAQEGGWRNGVVRIVHGSFHGIGRSKD